MARFRATMQGQRGMASRLGSAKSGMVVYVSGWKSGVRVEAMVDLDGNDKFIITETNGSSGGSPIVAKSLVITPRR